MHTQQHWTHTHTHRQTHTQTHRHTHTLTHTTVGPLGVWWANVFLHHCSSCWHSLCTSECECHSRLVRSISRSIRRRVPVPGPFGIQIIFPSVVAPVPVNPIAKGEVPCHIVGVWNFIMPSNPTVGHGRIHQRSQHVPNCPVWTNKHDWTENRYRRKDGNENRISEKMLECTL